MDSQVVPPGSSSAPAAPASGGSRAFVIGAQRFAYWLGRHWLLVLNGVVLLYLLGAALAPTLMRAGFQLPARVLYTAYSFTCHQLPERSYFLYGPEGAVASYNLDEVIRFGADGRNQNTLRTFIGSPEAGYKMAVSDRMISMYGGTVLGGILYGLLRRRRRDIPPLPLWGLILFAIPMALDGGTHMIDDVSGLGWRLTNTWAQPIFGNNVPADFYTGTDFGSLNSILRWVTGLLFGFGTVWFAYPLLGYGFEDIADVAGQQLRRLREREQAGLPTA